MHVFARVTVIFLLRKGETLTVARLAFETTINKAFCDMDLQPKEKKSMSQVLMNLLSIFFICDTAFLLQLKQNSRP